MLENMWDVFSAPILQIVAWLVFSLVLLLMAPRDRILVGTPMGGLLLTGLISLNDFLPGAPGAPFVGAAALFVGAALFVVPLVVYADRRARGFLMNIGERLPTVFAYLLTGSAGLLAFGASVAALIWVNDVHPALRGDYEIALLSGLLASNIAVIRLDRSLRARVDSPPTEGFNG